MKEGTMWSGETQGVLVIFHFHGVGLLGTLNVCSNARVIPPGP